MKKAIAAVILVLAVYVGFVSLDCIRLRSAVAGTKPFLTISAEEGRDRLAYRGLGYSVEYYVSAGENGGYGAEFRLFDRIPVWAWIE